MKPTLALLILFITCAFRPVRGADHSLAANPFTATSGADSTIPLLKQLFAKLYIGKAPVAEPAYHHLPGTVLEMTGSAVAAQVTAGYSKEGRSIDAYFFPGTGNLRALVIGGVHGSELSSVEVAHALVRQLQKETGNFYSVLVIPCLFPDNKAQAENKPELIGSPENIGRYSSQLTPDPNRQMPGVGQPYSATLPVDCLGRTIEPENRLLLELIHYFRPQRIVNIHAIRDPGNAGIFADPRTDHQGIALGFSADSSLAIQMAAFIRDHNGEAPGNHLDSNPTALYRSDPPVAPPGQWQIRNLHGSSLPGNRGHGVSLGTWATTAVYDPSAPRNNRAAMRLITMEFPGSKRPADHATLQKRQEVERLVYVYAAAIRSVFLQKVCIEADTNPLPDPGMRINEANIAGLP